MANRAGLGFFRARSLSKPTERSQQQQSGSCAPLDDDVVKLIQALLNGGPEGLEVLTKTQAQRPGLLRDALLEDVRFTSLFSELPTKLALTKDPEIWASAVPGKTPLMIALAREWKEGVDFLLPLSDLNARDEFRQGILTQALDQPNAWRWVIGACDANETGDLGMTALMTAVKGRKEDAVAALLRNPACDANAATHDGYTALTFAACLGDSKLTNLLIPSANEKNRAGAFKELLRRLEGAPDGEKEQWACVDALSAFVDEKSASRAFLIARDQAKNRMPIHAARQEAKVLRAEIGLLAPAAAAATGDARPKEATRPAKSRRL